MRLPIGRYQLVFRSCCSNIRSVAMQSLQYSLLVLHAVLCVRFFFFRKSEAKAECSYRRVASGGVHLKYEFRCMSEGGTQRSSLFFSFHKENTSSSSLLLIIVSTSMMQGNCASSSSHDQTKVCVQVLMQLM